MRLRLVQRDDAEAIRAIYNFEVANGTNTFDLVARTGAAQREWVERHRGVYPAIVAVEQGSGGGSPAAGSAARGSGGGGSGGGSGARGSNEVVLGFAVVSPYRNRAAYATTVEDSVYVHQDHRGKGVGRVLLEEVVALAGAHGFHAVIARISSENEASVRLHRSCGFELVGTEREVGRKHGRWLDVVELQRML